MAARFSPVNNNMKPILFLNFTIGIVMSKYGEIVCPFNIFSSTFSCFFIVRSDSIAPSDAFSFHLLIKDFCTSFGTRSRSNNAVIRRWTLSPYLFSSSVVDGTWGVWNPPLRKTRKCRLKEELYDSDFYGYLLKFLGFTIQTGVMSLKMTYRTY